MKIKTLKFKRFEANSPNLDEMYKIIRELESILEQGVNNPQLYSIINELTYLQEKDGSFALLDTFQVESDIRVEFCYYPTYLCTAILLLGYRAFDLPNETVLKKSLKMCLGRNLKGHGFDDISGQIKALRVFIKVGLPEMFHSDFRDICPEFTKAIENIIDCYSIALEDNNTSGSYGEDYRKDFQEIVDAFEYSRVFVYGTLLSNRSNSYLLKGSKLLGEGVLEDYGLYDLGAYPGIKPLKDASVKGELYRINIKTLKELDALEGEGFLYKREVVDILTSKGISQSALVYVYLKETKEERLIGQLNQPWNIDRKKDYIWYVSYGSNMLYERLLCYIHGGICSYNGKSYGPCSDASAPVKVKPVTIPYNMYYGNSSTSWDGMGVSFLDVSRPGQALGAAYLMTREQLEELNFFEGRNWYNRWVYLEPIEGYPTVTFTNRELRPKKEPSPAYKNVLFDGIKENYPSFSDSEIVQYIEGRNQI